MQHRQSSRLATGLFVLAGGLAANSVLGPLALGTIRYRFSETLVNQAIGLDAVALAGAVPLAILAGMLVLRRHPAGPVLAFIPAAFATYMAPQYVIGPEYLDLAGNNERFFLLHLALFVLAVALIGQAWTATTAAADIPSTIRSDRRRSLVLFGVAAFILLGRWLPPLIELTRGTLATPDFVENPTSFLLIGFLDLGLVVPAALAGAVGLRRGSASARTLCHAVIGWFALVPAAVAAMAVVMQVNDDPNGAQGTTLFFVVAAVVFTAGAALLYRPLFERPAEPSHAVRRLVGVDR